MKKLLLLIILLCPFLFGAAYYDPLTGRVQSTPPGLTDYTADLRVNTIQLSTDDAYGLSKVQPFPSTARNDLPPISNMTGANGFQWINYKGTGLTFNVLTADTATAYTYAGTAVYDILNDMVGSGGTAGACGAYCTANMVNTSETNPAQNITVTYVDDAVLGDTIMRATGSTGSEGVAKYLFSDARAYTDNAIGYASAWMRFPATGANGDVFFSLPPFIGLTIAGKTADAATDAISLVATFAPTTGAINATFKLLTATSIMDMDDFDTEVPLTAGQWYFLEIVSFEATYIAKVDGVVVATQADKTPSDRDTWTTPHAGIISFNGSIPTTVNTVDFKFINAFEGSAL